MGDKRKVQMRAPIVRFSIRQNNTETQAQRIQLFLDARDSIKSVRRVPERFQC